MLLHKSLNIIECVPKILVLCYTIASLYEVYNSIPNLLVYNI